MPNVVAPVLKGFDLSAHERFPAGSTFIQPTWYQDKYVLQMHLGGYIGDFDYDLLEPSVRESALNEEQRQRITASQMCGGCR